MKKDCAICKAGISLGPQELEGDSRNLAKKVDFRVEAVCKMCCGLMRPFKFKFATFRVWSNGWMKRYVLSWTNSATMILP